MAESIDTMLTRSSEARFGVPRLAAFVNRHRRAAEPFLFRWLTSKRWPPGSDAPRHGLEGHLVISLTSYPGRFDVLPLTLKCLLTQSVRPDTVVLWIAYDDFSQLPPAIFALQDVGLEIRGCPDTRSFKKIISALDAFSDSFIVTADDDLYYHPTWLEELVRAYDGDDRTVLCHRAHRIRLDNHGLPSPYDTWEMEIRDHGRSPLVFPTSGGGTLYPPRILPDETRDSSCFLRLCPTADDIWLYWMMRRNGGQARRVSHFRELIAWPGSQKTSLWSINIAENDRQIRAMVEHFGVPDATAARGDSA